MTDRDEGAYVWEPGPGGGQLSWIPPDGFPRQVLPAPRGSHLEGDLVAEAAESILQHATGDWLMAARHHRGFAADLLGRADPTLPLSLPADRVDEWLAQHDLRPAPGWTRHGPGPVITRATEPGSTGQYLVSLDGCPVLDVEVLAPASDGGLDARIGIHDRRELGGYAWDNTVQVGLPEDVISTFATDRRVTAESLPFGGWAIQVDEFDVAIVERTGEQDGHTRVAVYDRTPGADFLATEMIIPHQPVAAPPGIAERLRAFATPDPRVVLAR